ncbi:MAG TPA: hypothetical protein VMU05_00920 [Dongiaceae bacterium]|nr:hypothetical protein [Dongiaceae bacterium]
MIDSLSFLSLALLAAFLAPAQDQPLPQTHDMTSMSGTLDSLPHREELHMLMTPVRAPRIPDQGRAQQIVEVARQVLSKYRDPLLAERDGYHIVKTPVKRAVYHFTKYEFLREADSGQAFRPDHPVSLIYRKRGETFELIGVMYYAPKDASEDDLDRRIPLSVARWHKHVNVCMPPPGQLAKIWDPAPRFGEIGSIDSKKNCEAAGGRFLPQIYGWMVHMYLFETDPTQIWSPDRVSEEEEQFAGVH